jgi:hypothetical protein
MKTASLVEIIGDRVGIDKREIIRAFWHCSA